MFTVRPVGRTPASAADRVSQVVLASAVASITPSSADTCCREMQAWGYLQFMGTAPSYRHVDPAVLAEHARPGPGVIL
jgi:hypothetical protein